MVDISFEDVNPSKAEPEELEEQETDFEEPEEDSVCEEPDAVDDTENKVTESFKEPKQTGVKFEIDKNRELMQQMEFAVSDVMDLCNSMNIHKDRSLDMDIIKKLRMKHGRDEVIRELLDKNSDLQLHIKTMNYSVRNIMGRCISLNELFKRWKEKHA